jgi:hypothetical protein
LEQASVVQALLSLQTTPVQALQPGIAVCEHKPVLLLQASVVQASLSLHEVEPVTVNVMVSDCPAVPVAPVPV